MTESRIHTARRLGYETIEEAERNDWRDLTPAEREALAEHRRMIAQAKRADRIQEERRKTQLARRGFTEVSIPEALVKRARLGATGWIMLGALHLRDTGQA